MDSAVRVGVLSHSCVVALNQDKWAALARDYGAQVTVIAPQVWKTSYGQTLFLEKQEQRGLQIVGVRVTPNRKDMTYLYGSGLWRPLRELRPQVLQVEAEPYSAAAFQGAVLSKALGARLVVFSFQNLYRRFPPPFSWFEQISLRAASYAIAGNTDVRDVLLRKEPALASRIAISPHGVNPDRFLPCDAGALRAKLNAEGFLVGYVGALTHQKGVSLLLQALAGISRPWTAVIVGDGVERAALERMASDLEISERARFVGQVRHDEVPAYINAMDALVLPSITLPRLKEQQGRVLIEAMACRVPVIGSSSGEIPAVIGDAGIVFPEGDVPALRNAITRLADDRPLRDRLIDAGWTRVHTHYTWSAIARDLHDIYRTILDADHA